MSENIQHVHNDNFAHDVDDPLTLCLIWLSIIFLTFVNIWISMQSSGGYVIALQLIIAAIQVTLVGYHYMHLKHGDKVVLLTALASIFWVGILFILMLADYLSRHIVVAG